MTEINKDELLDLKKWQRFFFMLIYGFAINGVASILIVLAAIQFIFYLFSSQTNAKLQSANNWLLNFFNDSVNFVSFNTNSKPWPSVIQRKLPMLTKRLKLLKWLKVSPRKLSQTRNSLVPKQS